MHHKLKSHNEQNAHKVEKKYHITVFSFFMITFFL